MPYTPEQYTALVQAIAQGAKRVRYADKEVEYMSLDDMLQLKRQMEDALGLTSPGAGGPNARPSRLYTSVSKGL